MNAGLAFVGYSVDDPHSPPSCSLLVFWFCGVACPCRLEFGERPNGVPFWFGLTVGGVPGLFVAPMSGESTEKSRTALSFFAVCAEIFFGGFLRGGAGGTNTLQQDGGEFVGVYLLKSVGAFGPS